MEKKLSVVEDQSESVQKAKEILKKSETLYLQYFPAYGKHAKVDSYSYEEQKEADKEENDAEEKDKGRSDAEQDSFRTSSNEKKCRYCGNSHVYQDKQNELLICDECRRQMVICMQEYFTVICQVLKSMELLFCIGINVVPIVKHMGVFQRIRLLSDEKEDEFGFTKNGVKVDKEGNTLIFRFLKMLPRSEVIFIATICLMDCFFSENKRIDEMLTSLKELEKRYLLEWYGIHHLYLSGYVEFSRRKNKITLDKNGYLRWYSLLGTPVTGQSLTFLSLLEKIKKSGQLERP